MTFSKLGQGVEKQMGERMQITRPSGPVIIVMCRGPTLEGKQD